MPDKEFDPWAFTTGLPESYTGVIEDAFFEYSADYMDGKRPVLRLVIRTDDPEVNATTEWPGYDRPLYPMNEDWEPTDKGARLKRVDGTVKPLNGNTSLAVLATSAIEAGARDVLRQRGNPLMAGIWKGIRADFRSHEYTFTPREGGDPQKYRRMLMEKFLGVVGEGQTTTPTQAPAPAPSASVPPATPAPGPAPATANGNGGLDVQMKVNLMKLAKEVKAGGGDHSRFVEQAFTTVAGVMDNAPAEQAVMDNAEGSIWASTPA